MVEVSIVIPIFNAENYIDQCMASLMNQTMNDYEVILIDDGSTDGSRQVAEGWKEKYPSIVRVYSQQNAGQGDARNKGVMYAQGKYILFVDSDDKVAPDLVEEAYHAIIESHADMAIFDAVVVDEAGKKIEDMTGCHTDKKEISLETFPRLLLEYPCPWNKIYRRDFLIDNGLQYPVHMWYEDLVGACMFYACAKKVAVLHKTLYYYLQRPTSVMHSKVNPKNMEILKAVDLVLNYYREKGIYDKYAKELEYLAIYHILIAAAGRTVRGDARSSYPDQFMLYMNEKFPVWQKNPYIQELSKANQLKIWLLERRHYGVLHLLYNIGKKNTI